MISTTAFLVYFKLSAHLMLNTKRHLSATFGPKKYVIKYVGPYKLIFCQTTLKIQSFSCYLSLKPGTNFVDTM